MRMRMMKRMFPHKEGEGGEEKGKEEKGKEEEKKKKEKFDQYQVHHLAIHPLSADKITSFNKDCPSSSKLAPTFHCAAPSSKRI